MSRKPSDSDSSGGQRLVGTEKDYHFITNGNNGKDHHHAGDSEARDRDRLLPAGAGGHGSFKLTLMSIKRF
jgi:hypothetical protein